ncbi:MAG: HlyD family efflux transporter periplasmic adaptor subunit [Pirellulaceae bacterium]|nr:HlyD family efflux transporter periplasmic adaptor subunit [Pirellulaceae bacterium]
MTRLSVRMRPDLVLVPHGTGGDRHWVVQDPVSLAYYRLRDEECSLLRMLDGRSSLEDICERFERMFAPLRLGAKQLQAFLFRLHELGLIVPEAPGQGEVLHRRAAASRQRMLVAALANPLAIRLPGLPAGEAVDWLYARARWLFAPLFLALCAVLVLIAGGLVALQFGAFQARLPDFQSFFSLRSAGLVAVALVVVKVLHELGHALVCRHFGGRCREVGVIVLVGTPALYCDVSDAWRIESKWRRIAISAAGMGVELVIASAATILWWFSEPGLLNALCLRIMFVSSVGTVLFNANPFIRCDGYYILSDLVEAPNLWQDSRAVLKRLVAGWLCGMELPDDPTIPRRQRPWLALYGVVSGIYCTLLLLGILWFCWQVAEPRGLGPLALGLALLVATGLAWPPLRATAKVAFEPLRWRKMRRGRTLLTVVVAIALVAALLFVPLPARVTAPCWLEPLAAEPIYATVAGTLREALPAGTVVARGQTIATLDSAEVASNIAQLSADLAREQQRLKNLKILLADDPTAAPLIPAAEKTLEDLRRRLAQWQRDQDRLSLKADRAGIILPPPAVAPADTEAGSLSAWVGTPLDRRNRGCYLESGQLVALVGDPQRLEAVLIIEQGDMPLVRLGQRVSLRVEQGPVLSLSGQIVELSQAPARDLDEGLIRALDLPQATTNSAGPRTTHQHYQARVALDPHSAPLLTGMHGTAKISTPWQPLASRLWRYLQRTFPLAS